MKISASNRAGFTLVEIMIVVATIGMLASIAIPSTVKARATSQRNFCLNSLRQIDYALQDFALENKKAPTDTVTEADVTPYLKNPLFCPAGGTKFSDSYQVTDFITPPVCLSAGGGAANGHVLPQ